MLDAMIISTTFSKRELKGIVGRSEVPMKLERISLS